MNVCRDQTIEYVLSRIVFKTELFSGWSNWISFLSISDFCFLLGEDKLISVWCFEILCEYSTAACTRSGAFLEQVITTTGQWPVVTLMSKLTSYMVGDTIKLVVTGGQTGGAGSWNVASSTEVEAKIWFLNYFYFLADFGLLCWGLLEACWRLNLTTWSESNAILGLIEILILRWGDGARTNCPEGSLPGWSFPCDRFNTD